VFDNILMTLSTSFCSRDRETAWLEMPKSLRFARQATWNRTEEISSLYQVPRLPFKQAESLSMSPSVGRTNSDRDGVARQQIASKLLRM
jgi:hypothetical protein